MVPLARRVCRSRAPQQEHTTSIDQLALLCSVAADGIRHISCISCCQCYCFAAEVNGRSAVSSAVHAGHRLFFLCWLIVQILSAVFRAAHLGMTLGLRFAA
jgi:hypothetical protein